MTDDFGQRKAWDETVLDEDDLLHIRVRRGNGGYHVDFEVRSVGIELESKKPTFPDGHGGWHDDPEKGELDLSGYIKWDGCANVSASPDHLCGRGDARKWGRVWERLYDLAIKLMPGNEEHLRD